MRCIIFDWPDVVINVLWLLLYHIGEKPRLSLQIKCQSLCTNYEDRVKICMRYAPSNVKLLGGFELRSVFLFKCPAPGKSSWVKKVQIPYTRVILLLVKRTQRKIKSPYHGQTCNVKPTSMQSISLHRITDSSELRDY